jgi:acetyl-CoA carboxylase carboxyltransferase component
MAPEVALNVMIGKKLRESDKPEELRAAFLAEMSKMNAPWEAAGKNLLDKIIDPRDTRKELLQALKMAQGNKSYVRSKRLMANWLKIA